IVAHRANWFFALGEHWLQDSLDIFNGIAKRLHAADERWFIADRASFSFEIVRAGENHPPHVITERSAFGFPGLDIVVSQQRAAFVTDGDHLAGSEPPFFDNALRIQVDRSRLGSCYHQAFGRDGVSSRSQTVAVERSARDSAVAERNSGRP